MKKIILLDMDHVIMDFAGGVVKQYNKEFEEKITADMLDDWDFSILPNGKRLDEIWREKDFFLNLELLNDAGIWVPKIAEEYDTYICSHAINHIYHEKEMSLEKHFGDIFDNKVFFAMDKHLIRGDFLLDDKIDNLIKFDKTVGTPVCYNGPHNTYRKDRPANWDGFRVNTMEEFYKFLKERT